MKSYVSTTRVQLAGLPFSSTNGFSLTGLSLLGSRRRKAGWRASMPLSMTAHARSRQEMSKRRRAASALMASVDRDTVGAASRLRLTEYTMARGSGMTPRTSSATATTSCSQSASVAAATPSPVVVKARGSRPPLRTIVSAPTTRIIHRRSERTRSLRFAFSAPGVMGGCSGSLIACASQRCEVRSWMSSTVQSCVRRCHHSVIGSTTRTRSSKCSVAATVDRL